jgi:hypothetical protein
MDKKATVEITFSAKNSDQRNCFFRLSLVNLEFEGKEEFMIGF